MGLSIDERVHLIREVAEELINEKELREMLEVKLKSGEPIYAYDGFEPSGRIHIAQGLLRAINVNKLIQAGIKFKFLVADWHAAANKKFDGNLQTIKKVGKYFVEVWKACGMDLSNVEFIWASDLVKKSKYWETVLNISMKTTLNRTLRCTQIMGRKDTDELLTSQVLYPMMQCADIFYMDVDICQLGMDQRKVNMLAREIAKHFNRPKPIAVHHHMLAGLIQPPPDSELDAIERAIERKMSKSNPNSAVFMLDTKEEIEAKIKKAWCPPEEIDGNPILEYTKYIIFEKESEFEIRRSEKYGGNFTYSRYQDLEDDYAAGKLTPMDLKPNVARILNEFLIPIREHFEKNAAAKKLFEFVMKVQSTQTK
ncbi:MAG: tyrosine--tRNA ligase [Candidatus Lokiarchaeota archaeon]|nr:tyrosine--tRNA ligase [Candidatus Lokiarchaeota archaeon]